MVDRCGSQAPASAERKRKITKSLEYQYIQDFFFFPTYIKNDIYQHLLEANSGTVPRF